MKNEKQIASVPTVWYNAQDLKSSNEAGYYMLKDNRRSRDSVYDYEKGIVINDDIYLTLNYPKHELTKSEAQAFCRIKGGRIPDSFELWQIQMARDEIERSLARITYPQRELPADIMSCWCSDRSDSELSETRRPLLLIDGKRHNPGDSVQKHGDLVILNKQYVFVWENGKYVPKNLELWAVSEKNSLFALKADWSEVYLFTQAPGEKLAFKGCYKHLGEDVFESASCLYQYDKGEMRKFCHREYTSVSLSEGTVNVRYYKVWMSGCTQEMHDDLLTEYKRDADGLWQEAGTYDYGFVKEY